MPPGIGYGMGGGPAGAPSDPTGMPQPGVMTSSLSASPDQQAMCEIIAMLRGGQVGAERFIQLLSLLAASTMQGQGAGAPPQQVPQQAQQQQPPPDITALLGG